MNHQLTRPSGPYEVTVVDCVDGVVVFTCSTHGDYQWRLLDWQFNRMVVAYER